MVEAQGRSVQAGGAVVEHADAVPVQTANHRSTGIRAKVSAGHTGQTVQGLAQGALASLEQVSTPQGIDGQRGLIAAQRIASDEDFSIRHVLCSGDRGTNQQANGHGHGHGDEDEDEDEDGHFRAPCPRFKKELH